MGYVIITAQGTFVPDIVVDLGYQVNNYMREGWNPQGGPSIVCKDGLFRIIQALIIADTVPQLKVINKKKAA